MNFLTVNYFRKSFPYGSPRPSFRPSLLWENLKIIVIIIRKVITVVILVIIIIKVKIVITMIIIIITKNTTDTFEK